ncbi:hypothetical protein [Pseudomonas kuykendallii]|uniref:hypothetical protein n=1 Tax=Pseudomonas kuykendallii TaxID=1007099 RepID=UPI0028D0698B|nr:hypothetical protein [Pseudomonas kuykendallii]
MKDEIDRITAILNHQKGELIGVNAMLAALARTLPPPDRERLFQAFDTEVQHAHSNLSYSQVPDEVLQGVENYSGYWQALRVETPPS